MHIGEKRESILLPSFIQLLQWMCWIRNFRPETQRFMILIPRLLTALTTAVFQLQEKSKYVIKSKRYLAIR